MQMTGKKQQAGRQPVTVRQT